MHLKGEVKTFSLSPFLNVISFILGEDMAFLMFLDFFMHNLFHVVLQQEYEKNTF